MNKIKNYKLHLPGAITTQTRPQKCLNILRYSF